MQPFMFTLYAAVLLTVLLCHVDFVLYSFCTALLTAGVLVSLFLAASEVRQKWKRWNFFFNWFICGNRKLAHLPNERFAIIKQQVGFKSTFFNLLTKHLCKLHLDTCQTFVSMTQCVCVLLEQ